MCKAWYRQLLYAHVQWKKIISESMSQPCLDPISQALSWSNIMADEVMYVEGRERGLLLFTRRWSHNSPHSFGKGSIDAMLGTVKGRPPKKCSSSRDCPRFKIVTALSDNTDEQSSRKNEEVSERKLFFWPILLFIAYSCLQFMNRYSLQSSLREAVAPFQPPF